MSINRVNISGNLTRDPELRATQGGMQVLGFGVAVNDRRRNQQTGEWEDYPNFVDCTMFGNRAESMGLERFPVSGHVGHLCLKRLLRLDLAEGLVEPLRLMQALVGDDRREQPRELLVVLL